MYAFISYAPRAPLFLKTTAILVTAVFLLWTLPPPALAADLTARRPSPPPPAPTDAERLSQTLEHVERHLDKLETKLSQKQDVAPEHKELKALREELNALDRKAMQDFDAIAWHLREKHLPPEILNRHTAAVKTYKTEMTALKTHLGEVYWANDDSERRLKAKKAREHLKAKQKKRPHAKFDPKTVPSHAPKSKQRQPRLRQQEFAELQPPIRLAFNGNISALLLTQVALPLPTADDLAETPEVQFSPDIQRLVTLFERSPIALYEFVRNNFTYDPYYGSVKGSQSTLLLQAGNDFDQASVLIALYRAAGIPARYVYGTVEIPVEKAMKWLGVITNPKVVGEALVSNGIPAKMIVSGGTYKSVQLEHVWVEAYLPYENYRGVINDPNAKRSWIPLDPSFKLHDPNANAVDLAAVQNFDADAFFNQYLQAPQPDTPSKEYLRRSIDYVTANLPGQLIYDLLSSGPIQEKVLELLPNTLAYPTKVIGSRFAQVPDALRHRVSFELGQTNAIDFSPSLQYTATWTSLLHKRFTLSYEPATAADAQTVATYGNLYDTPPYLIYVKPILKLEGQTVAEGGAVPMASDLTFRMTFTAANGEHQQTINNTLIAGATHAMALDSGYMNGRGVISRLSKWESSVLARESGDPVLGEILNLLAFSYLQQLDFSRKTIARTMKLVDTNHQAEVMVGVDLTVQFAFGIPRTVNVAGVVIDVDRNISLALDVEGNHSKTRRFYLLDGLTSSSLEHHIFERTIALPGVSAVKALQAANTQGIPIATIDATNIAARLPALQIDPDTKRDIEAAINAGMVATVSERNVTINSWNGVGYILLDPTTGTGLYRISGGLSGGGLTLFIKGLKGLIKTGLIKDEQKAKEYIVRFRKLIWFPPPVTAEIGRGFIPPPGSRDYHEGVDFTVPINTPVYAVGKGKVIRADRSDLYGLVVYVDHGLGVVTRYAHNCTLHVAVGAAVDESTHVADSGNTGQVCTTVIDGSKTVCRFLPVDYQRCVDNKGAHVHFVSLIGNVEGSRESGTAVDPVNYFGNQSLWMQPPNSDLEPDPEI